MEIKPQLFNIDYRSLPSIYKWIHLLDDHLRKDAVHVGLFEVKTLMQLSSCAISRTEIKRFAYIIILYQKDDRLRQYQRSHVK